MEIINPIVRRWQRQAAAGVEGFWGRAAEQLPWFRKWDRGFDWMPPTFRWYVGGQTIGYGIWSLEVFLQGSLVTTAAAAQESVVERASWILD